jgi:hypothetical protein
MFKNTSTDAILPSRVKRVSIFFVTSPMRGNIHQQDYFIFISMYNLSFSRVRWVYGLYTGIVEMCIKFTILVMVEGDVQVVSGRRTGCLWKTFRLIVRDVSVDFLFTLCTFSPLYTSRGLWKCVSVHSDR